MNLLSSLERDLFSLIKECAEGFSTAHFHIIVLKFVFRHGPKQGECVRDKFWAKQTDCGGFDVHSQLHPQKRHKEEGKAESRHKPLQWKSVWECVGACHRRNEAQIHPCLCADYQDVNQEEWWSRKNFFSPPLLFSLSNNPGVKETTETPLKGDKPAHTTSEPCCVLPFSNTNVLPTCLTSCLRLLEEFGCVRVLDIRRGLSPGECWQPVT